MKILILTNHSYMLYQFRRELIAELLKNHEVILSMPFVGHEEDFEEIGCKCINTEIDRRGINPIKDFRLLYYYYKLIKKERPHMVISFSIKPNIYGGIVCSILKVPYFANVQGLGTAFEKKGLEDIVSILYKLAFSRVSTAFFENTVDSEKFIKRKILSEDKITVLPGAGVNLDYYKYSPYPKEEAIRFLFVGRIMKEKGVDELFEAAIKLKEKYRNRIIFDIVGFFEDEYKEVIEKLEKADVVNFHGFQQEVRTYYASSHCVILPSYHEGMSNVLLEAAASGRPIITSDIPGCREAVEEGINGYLCEAKNSKSLYETIEAFIKLNKDKHAEMGIKSREKMIRDFDKKRVVSRTLKEIFS
ncbi:glycosyltransferase family 4 protein [Alloiococcus sp. CFN-8]|uniref:glycosyltransferase family 4 protein n=1 Tax=Alloiococcus sp. CFN-8 TaxID=3416081 RepID=UPI003CEBA1AB